MPITPQIELHYAAFTHPGKHYRKNQDAVLLAGNVQQSAGFWQGQIPLTEKIRFAIADGVGGLPNGAAASRTLLSTLAELDIAQPQLSPRQRLIPLQSRLIKISKAQRGLRNAGSTLITVEINTDGRITLWHVGDSRGYFLDHNGLRRLTEDHTLAYCLARTNQHKLDNLEAFKHTRIGQALDNLFVFSVDAEEPFIGLRSLLLAVGERLLLVSDGITRYCDDALIMGCLADGNIEKRLPRLFELAMETPAEDNISAIALSLQGDV